MTLGVITADVPVLDDCPVLTRLKAFVAPLGMVPTLEHVLRDKRGRPLDLSDYFTGSSESESESESSGGGKLYLRSKEIVAPAGGDNPVIQVEGTCIEPMNGLVRFALTPEMVRQAGIYQLSIAVADANSNTLHVENPLLWIEKSLFTLDPSDTTFDKGPPSIQEIRQTLMDSGAGDNLLLDNVEFSDDQIAYAMSRPIHMWNHAPPPLRPELDTRNFPYADDWLNAIVALLFITAAHNYRRNHLPYNAGGVAVDDKNKEQSYLTIGEKMLKDYADFVQAQKYQINVGLFQGHVGSSYGGMFF